MFAPTAAYLYDVDAFLSDWLADLDLEQQHQRGVIPFVVPDILKYLDRPGNLPPADSTAIWSDAIVEESNLSRYIHVLRSTLGEQADGKPFIETFRRRGYRFNAEVSLLNSSTALTVEPLVELPGPNPRSDANGEGLSGNVIDVAPESIRNGAKVRCTWTDPLPSPNGGPAVRLPQWVLESEEA